MHEAIHATSLICCDALKQVKTVIEFELDSWKYKLILSSFGLNEKNSKQDNSGLL